jgi:aminoglycoside phosphotransferase (APT) family kinase protein
VSEPAQTSPAPARHELDEAALRAYLYERIEGFDEMSELSRIKGGQSNPTYYLRAGDAEYVLRKKPPGKLLPTAHAIEREFRILDALAETDVPVPAVRHLCEDSSVIGTPFYVMDFIAGRTLRDPLLPGMSKQDRTAIYDSMIDVLARMHCMDWQSIGLEGFGKTDSYFSRQLARWSKQYESSKTQDVPAMDKLIGWLGENIPENETTTIAHGDFRLENLLVDSEKPEVVAILDWELSTLGHPMADLAFNCMTYYLPSDSDIAPGFIGTDIEALGIPSEEEYVAAYCRRTGSDVGGDWMFYVAFSLFRIAAIQQGIYARALAGSASSNQALKFGDMFMFVAEQGWKQVDARKQ